MRVLAKPLGLLMRTLYELLGSYSLAIIIFALIIRLIQLPFVFNDQKSNAKRRALRPKFKDLKKTYATNPGLYQEKVMLLQSQYGITSSGSCLSSIISMLILYGMIEVIYHPAIYILGMTKEQISAYGNELIALSSQSDFNMGFIDVARVPTFTPSVWDSDAILALIIPSLSALIQLLMMFLGKLRARKYEPESVANKGSINILSLAMPIFSIVISYSFPLGIGLYWTASAMFNCLITLCLWIVFSPSKDEILLESTKITDKENWKYKLLHKLNNPPAIVKKKVLTEDDMQKKVIECNKKIDRAIVLLTEKYGS